MIEIILRYTSLSVDRQFTNILYSDFYIYIAYAAHYVYFTKEEVVCPLRIIFTFFLLTREGTEFHYTSYIFNFQ